VLRPNEIVTEILAPACAGASQFVPKVRSRQSWDFALAGVALALKFNGDRWRRPVSFRAARPIPWRSKEVEEAVTGNDSMPTPCQCRRGRGQEAEPLDQNGYKIPCSAGSSKRTAAIARIY
jgi:xanthine dehydrogenase YagS FAD-binding subunit